MRLLKMFYGKECLAETSWKFLAIAAQRRCIDGLNNQGNITLGTDGVQIRLRDVFIEQEMLAWQR